MGFARSQGRTVLKHRRQIGPLATQRPLYPEGGICHTYILHPPGGVVAGDTLDIHCTVHENAHAVLTSPGATKFYLSTGAVAMQQQTLHIANGADMEYLPQENIFFNGCHARIQTDIHYQTGGRFMVWEAHCFGRPANRQTYTCGTVHGRTRIFMDTTQVLNETIAYDATSEGIRAVGLQHYPMQASFYISCDARTPNLIDTIRNLITDRQLLRQEGICGVTQMGDIIVVRMFSVWAETIRCMFVRIWQSVRFARYNTAATVPRIWHT